MANPVLVSQINKTSSAVPSATSQSSQHCTPALQLRKGTSIGGEVSTDGMSLIRESLRNKGISERTQELILQSWREGTQKQYRTYLQRWTTFSSGRDIDPIQPTISEVIDFLTELFDSGLGYSGLNTACCALSSVIHLDDNRTVGSHPLVNRFLKAAFINRPSIPRSQSVWDPTRVLTYLKTLPPLGSISLKELTHKLVMLTALVTGQRCQSFHLMDLSSMQQNADHYKFIIQDFVKQSAPGRKQPELILPVFPADCRVCVYSVLSEYIKCTAPLRGGETRLFISFVKPHQAVSRDTISRWIKNVMIKSGIDVGVFKPHSTRAASTSKANACQVPIDLILKAASWKGDCTFRKFYNKPFVDDVSYFGQAVLGTSTAV